MTYVLDNSFLVSWIMPDEQPDAVMKFFESGRFEKFLVPPVWPLEFASALAKARNEKRVRVADVARILVIVRALDIEVIGTLTKADVESTLEIFERTGLSPNDASYLMLARRFSLPLLTLDAKLRTVAQGEGIETPL